jgi:hypothetical protein
LGADIVTGSTGSFKYLGADIVTGSTGNFVSLGSDDIDTTNLIFSDGSVMNASNAQTYDYNMIFKNVLPIASVGTSIFSALSSNGQYQLLASTTGFSYSKDFGASWTTQPATLSLDTTQKFLNIAMSADGSFIVYTEYGIVDSVSGKKDIKFNALNTSKTSNNTITQTLVNADENVQGISISGTGKYISIVTTANMYVSSTYGASWKSPFGINFSGTSMSLSGKYHIVFTSDTVYISSNYGVTFDNWINRSGNHYIQVLISASGKYQTIATNDYIYKSTDYGKTWTGPILQATGGALCMDFSGKILLGKNKSISTDYGATWLTGSANDLTSIAISGSGQYQLFTTPAGNFISALPLTNLITSKIGFNAGLTGQNANAIAIGTNAGAYNQGTGSIAIGYMAGPTGMSANSIALNASGTALYGTGPTGGFYVAPIASYKNASNPTGPFHLLAYGPDNQIVTVTGTTGLNLSLSTPTVTYDSWMLSNIIGAPPAPELIAIVKQPDDLFIIFKYPQQYQIGILNTLVPFINDAVLTTNGSNNLITITNQQPKDFYKENLINEPVQCLHFFSKTNTQQNTDYTHNNVTYKTRHFPLASGNCSFYYKNHNTTSLYNALKFTISYSQAGYPSNVIGDGTGTIILSFQTTSVEGGGNSPTITINLKSDEVYSDNINGYPINSTYPLTNVITYSSILNSNSVRYDGTKVVTDATNFRITSSPSLYQITSSIYPDTKYNFILKSTNKSDNFTTSNTITMESLTTPGINIKALKSTYNFISSNSLNNMFSLNPLTTTLAIPIGSTTSVTVITDTSSDITGTVNYNVQNSFENRGKLSSIGVNDVSTSLNLNGAIATSTSFNIINTWSSRTAQTVGAITGNIQLSPGALSDLNTDLDDAYSGYYAKCPLSIKIKTSAYLTSASSSSYTVTVSGTYPTTNAPIGTQNSLTYKYTSQPFYYDGPLPTPTCTINSLTITTPPTQISGITLYNGDINVTPDITVSDIGTHFYNSTQIVAYSGSFDLTSTTVKKNNNNTTETGLPDDYTSLNKSGTFRNPLTFTKKLDNYSKSLSLTATAYNIRGTETADTKTDTKTLNIIYDTKSVLITSIQEAYINPSTTPNGCRVYSTTNAGETENKSSAENMSANANFTNNGTTYSFYNENTPLYDNTISIGIESPYRKELLYASGMYVTPAYIPNFYSNYSANRKYSDIVSSETYRYVTFAWKVPDFIFQNPTTYDTLTFNMLGVSGITITNNLAYTGINLLEIFYRVEDVNALSIATGGTKTITTYWINANSNIGTQIGSANCFIGASPAQNYLALSQPNTQLVGNTCIFPAKTGGYTFSSASSSASTGINNTQSTVYIYCRVGVALESNFSFTGMNCIISSS